MTPFFKSQITEIFQLKNSILYCDFFLSTYNDMDAAREHVQGLQNTLGSHKALFLIDIVGVKKASKDFRDYMASDDVAVMSTAHAIYIDSGIAKIMGNLYLKFSKPKIPTKIFTSKEDAIEWLLSIKK